MTVKIGILGANGRLGSLLCQLVSTSYADRAKLNAEASQGDSLMPLSDGRVCDVVVDFSSPEASSHLAKLALERLKKGEPVPAFVIGTTGWAPGNPERDRTHWEELAKHTPVMISSNYSMGVLSLLHTLKTVAPVLKRLGYTPAIVETHHCHKKDAPSGTALTLAKTITAATGDTVQTLSIRAGEVIGDHDVSFFGPADKLVFQHHAQDRSVFARGALDVALWIKNQKPGHLIPVESFFNSCT